jgi:hypothetical protein
MQPRRWASLMELGAAQDFPWAGMRRIILIDINRNPLLYAAIRARIAGFSGVFIDRDGDRFLDANERTQSPVGNGNTDASP